MFNVCRRLKERRSTKHADVNRRVWRMVKDGKRSNQKGARTHNLLVQSVPEGKVVHPRLRALYYDPLPLMQSSSTESKVRLLFHYSSSSLPVHLQTHKDPKGDNFKNLEAKCLDYLRDAQEHGVPGRLMVSWDRFRLWLWPWNTKGFTDGLEEITSE